MDMTEKDFRLLLLKVDHLFRPRKMGTSGDSWIAVGTTEGRDALDEIRRRFKSEPYQVDVRAVGETVIIRAEPQPALVLKIPKIPTVHLVLFLLTVLTTLLAGALMEGGNPFRHPAELQKGIPFSVTLLLILGCHEFGHYYFARRHNVDATLPYFIPAPTFIGTFGAFIKIRSPIYRRDALLQIGAAGPIAGFLVAVPALIIGLRHSRIMDLSGQEGGILLGDSLLMKLLTALTHPGLVEGQDILLHPIAFAGWIGLLVTMLNLLPIGQLDGGHIAYAILGKLHARVAVFALLALIPLSFFSLNWLVWGALILILMRTAKHPPILDIESPLTRGDKWIGALCLSIFILCFVPAPFKG